ncbi:hypothetical protein RYX36_030960 [Vicia faba]
MVSFKNWDIKWYMNAEFRKQYKHEFVEILPDYVEGKGVSVAYLGKLKGSVMENVVVDAMVAEGARYDKYVCIFNNKSFSLFTPQESQTSPKPNPVLKTLDAQKGTLLQASLQITDSTTSRPVPAMPAENWVRSSGSYVDLVKSHGGTLSQAQLIEGYNLFDTLVF